MQQKESVLVADEPMAPLATENADAANIVEGFRHVTEETGPKYHIQFLDAVDAAMPVGKCKARMLKQLRIEEGHHVLDLGCGVGHEVQRIGRLVGPEGRSVGLDKSELLIAEARRRVEGHDLPVEFHVGDIHELFYEDESFDRCRAERVFKFLEAPDRALAEVVRILRPGGRVVLYELDADGFLIHGSDTELTRRVVRFMGDSIPNGWMGRRLPALFRGAGLVDIERVPFLWDHSYQIFRFVFSGLLDRAQKEGVLSPDEAQIWWEDQERAQRDGEFLVAAPGFIVSGHRP